MSKKISVTVEGDISRFTVVIDDPDDIKEWESLTNVEKMEWLQHDVDQNTSWDFEEEDDE